MEKIKMNYKYKAFISSSSDEYNRSHAMALYKALRKYERPTLFKKSPFEFFWDEGKLPLGDILPQKIREALKNSEYFIYLASNSAVESRWVLEELRFWCDDLRRANNVIVVLVDDQIKEREIGKIDWSKTNALPSSILAKHFINVPVYEDLTWARSDEDRTLKNSRYIETINRISSRFHAITPSERAARAIRKSQSKLKLRNTQIVEEKEGDRQELYQEKGEILEESILEIFREFFSITNEHEEMILTKARRQQRGAQYGHDISLEYEIEGKKRSKCFIEVKNFRTKIRVKDIADKLISQKTYYPDTDHWILISPHANVSKELDSLLEIWEKNREFPFKIQVWTPDTQVEEFFGLKPEIYDLYYKPLEGQLHPREWSEEKRMLVHKRWMEKLKPPFRLPENWETYVKNPSSLCLKNEKPLELDKIFQQSFTLKCKDETGRPLSKSLEENVREWLNNSQKSFLFLLGEFGDGKTFFTYLLARKLSQEFLTDPWKGVIPIRFALADFKEKDSPEEFVGKRLAIFGADLESFTSLKNKYRFLIMLDGFDEMSKMLDHNTISCNINRFRELCKYFKGLKILITSRAHVFNIIDNQYRLFKELESPLVLLMGPVDRSKANDFLRAYITEKEIRELIERKSNKDYLDARSKLLSLKEILPEKFESLKNELGFFFSLDSRPDDDIHEEFFRNFLDAPSYYGAQFVQKVEQGCIGIAMPDGSFMAISEVVFNLISKNAIMRLEQLEPQERIKERTIKVEQLFKSTLYEFAEEELRKNFDLIERNPGVISEDVREKNLDILKEYYNETLLNNSMVGEGESREQILRFRNALNLILEWGEYFAIGVPEEKTAASIEEVEKTETKMRSPRVDGSKYSYEKGEKLERALFELFQQLFRLNASHEVKSKPKKIGENDLQKKTRYLEQKRWQKGGTQYGYDLEFTWKEALASTKSEVQETPEIKCYVECKHYSGSIDLNELFGKLAQMSVNQTQVDHWILISPHANLSNDAINILEQTRKNYTFDIHIWTQESGVEELFGIAPEVFEEFFILPDKYKADKIRNPGLWSDEYRQTVIEKWLNKLPPKYRLPNKKLLPETWVENLRNAEKTLISYAGENYEDMASEKRVAITDEDRLCIIEDGSVGNLFDEFLNWLESEECRILAVLGEFGSGKSLHSYSLGIKTAEMFLKDPENSRIPIRLTLKNCMHDNIQAVLEKQLYEMNTSYEEYSALNPKEKILFILDGFDEMSRYITHEMTRDRFEMLYRLCESHKAAKILLTCRTQYFKSAEEEKEILEELEDRKKYKIKKLYLGKFTEKEISTCIENRYSSSQEDKKPQEIEKEMRSKYDLMGMSSNPLILSMITEILDDIPQAQRDISQTGIYKTYVEKWLEREIKKCTINFNSDRKQMKEGVKQVMYELAHQVYRKKDFRLSYKDLKGCLTPDKLEALEIFQKITTFTGKSVEEISEGVKTRSFLVREEDYFRFVHRSIMEYFIAEKLFQEIMEERKGEYLGAIQLSFEITHFLADLVMHRNPEDFLHKLQKIKFPTKRGLSENGKWLGTNILSVFYTIKKAMIENGQKISGVQEDWSGIAAHSSLLMNTDLSNAIFRDADLTESHFENAILENSDFTNADLTNIVLGETDDILFSKWGQQPEELPHSIHSDGNLFKWEITKKTPEQVFQIGRQDIIPPYDICFYDGSKELFIGGALLAEKEGREKKIQRPKLLSIDSSGSFIACYKNNRIIVFDVQGVNNLLTIPQKGVSTLYLSPGGKFLAYVVTKKEVYFQGITDSSARTIESKDNSSSATSIAINQEGSNLFVGFENGEIKGYQRDNGKDVFTLIWSQPVHEKAVRNISLNAFSNQLLSCGADKKICIVDAKDGQKKQQLQMLLKCKGMKIKNAKGLSVEKIDELKKRGAVI